MDGRQKKKRAEEATIQFWFEMKHVRSLAILPREADALRAAGYDPERMICVERFDDESVFAQISVGKPIQIGLKDGGGKPYCGMRYNRG